MQIENNNILRATHKNPYNPYHLSIGALVITPDNKILVHKRTDNDMHTYELPTKTVRINETYRDTITRLLAKELNITEPIQRVAFLGSTVATDMWWGELGDPKEVEKTTLWFVIWLNEEHIAKTGQTTRYQKEYVSTNIIKMTLEEALNVLDSQFKKTSTNFLNYTKPLQRYMKIVALQKEYY